MLAKYLKYALLVNAEIVSMTSERVNKSVTEFVNDNADEDYKQSLSNTFDSIEDSLKKVSPHIESVINTVEDIKKKLPF